MLTAGRGSGGHCVTKWSCSCAFTHTHHRLTHRQTDTVIGLAVRSVWNVLAKMDFFSYFPHFSLSLSLSRCLSLWLACCPADQTKPAKLFCCGKHCCCDQSGLARQTILEQQQSPSLNMNVSVSVRVSMSCTFWCVFFGQNCCCIKL